MKIESATIVRTIVLLLALINQCLVMAGKPVIPIEDATVEAVVTGKRVIKSIKVDPEAVDPDDVEMLQDLIVAAVNEALRAAENDVAASMQSITGGLGLPF